MQNGTVLLEGDARFERFGGGWDVEMSMREFLGWMCAMRQGRGLFVGSLGYQGGFE